VHHEAGGAYCDRAVRIDNVLHLDGPLQAVHAIPARAAAGPVVHPVQHLQTVRRVREEAARERSEQVDIADARDFTRKVINSVADIEVYLQKFCNSSVRDVVSSEVERKAFKGYTSLVALNDSYNS
jgi:hypothetical protein